MKFLHCFFSLPILVLITVYSGFLYAQPSQREIKVTVLIKESHVKKLKALSYWKQAPLKELVNEALENYLKDKKIPALPIIEES